MGIGKAGSAPPPTDPGQIAKQQGVANTATAIAQTRLNNTNQVTPYGNLTYTETGGGYDSNNTWVPQFTATQTLSPEQQKLFDTQQQISQGTSDLAKGYIGRIGEATAQPFSYDGMPAAPVYDEAARIAARDRIIARDQPNQDRDRDAVIARLANQGIAPGSAAYQTAMDQYQRGVNDYRLGADLQAGSEASRIFGLQGDMRSRAIQEEIQRRSQPINEVAALLGTGPGVQNPSFVSTPQSQIMPTDVAGIYANSDRSKLEAWQTQKKSDDALMGAIFGMAGAGLGGWARAGFPSDERIKENIERIATTPNGLGIYSYNHIGESARRIGLMAQEVEKVRPAAVFEVNGVKHVDYAEALR